MQKSVIFVKKNLKYLKDKYRKVTDHCHYTGNIEVLCIAHVIQNTVYLKKFI